MKIWIFKNRNKMIAWVVSIAILFGLSGFTTSFAMDGELIRVGLKTGVTSVNVSGDGDLILCEVNGDSFDTYKGLNTSSIKVSIQSGEIIIADSSGNEITRVPNDQTYVVIADEIIKLEGVSYRGGLSFFNKSSSMNVINYLEVDEYLYGVLNAEMWHESHMEALKAQAVAARSFVMSGQTSHEKEGYDVCTSTHCQVYKGYSGEYPRTNQAVDDTSGLCLYSSGSPVQGYYHKNSGGYTEDSENVWSAKLAYLRGVEDIYSPEYPWTASLTHATIKSKLDAAGYSLGNIESVSIEKRTDNGNVYEIKIQGSSKAVTLQKDSIRSMFGTTLIKSLNFELGDSTSSDSTSSGTSSGVLSLLDKSEKSSAGTEIYILDSSGTKTKVQTDSLYLRNSTATVKAGSGTVNTVSVATSDPVVFIGYGYGHGIGMAQDGAMNMANQGFTFREILQFYYTDVVIK